MDITRKLTELEKRVIEAITVTTPFMYPDCERIYRHYNSFDKTISHIEWCCKNGADINI